MNNIFNLSKPKSNITKLKEIIDESKKILLEDSELTEHAARVLAAEKLKSDNV
jgi:hypothetical protein